MYGRLMVGEIGGMESGQGSGKDLGGGSLSASRNGRSMLMSYPNLPAPDVRTPIRSIWPCYSVGTTVGRVPSVAGSARESSVAAAESAPARSAVPGNGLGFPHGTGC
jgi:hypothetical protein